MDTGLILAIVIAILIVVVLLIVLLVVFLSPKNNNNATAPVIQSFTSTGNDWCSTRYSVAFANNVFSSPSQWTPTAIVGLNNINPALRVVNANNQHVVKWRRQTAAVPGKWFPAEIFRVNGTTFIDRIYSCPSPIVDPVGVPEFVSFSGEPGLWHPTSYSASVDEITFTDWTVFYESDSNVYPSFRLNNLHGRHPIWRRRFFESDDIGEIVHMIPSTEADVFIDVEVPFYGVQVLANQNTFFVDMGNDHYVTASVKPQFYILADLLSEITAIISRKTENEFVIEFNPATHTLVAYFTQMGDGNLMFRVVTSESDNTPPSVDQGVTLNSTLGFVCTPDASLSTFGQSQVASAPPKLQYKNE